MDVIGRGEGMGGGVEIYSNGSVRRVEVLLGTHQTIDDLVRAVVEKGHRVGSYAAKVIAKITLHAGRKTCGIVRVSGEELGCKKEDLYGEVCRKAFALGYSLCPAEVVLQLRLMVQEPGTNAPWLLIPIEGLGASQHSFNLDVFSIGRDYDGSWICCESDRAEGLWLGEDLVFIKR